MAVPTETLSDRYDCNGSNQAFPITFEYLSSDNIAVQLYDGSLGTYATLVEDTDYTLANDTVTTVATYAAKYDIIIQLDPDLTQLTDWVNNDKFTSDSWENAVDKLTLIAKMLQDQIDRCVRGPDGDASLEWKLADGAVDRAGNYLHFNSITGAIETVGVLTASITATAFAQTILDDVSMGDVLTTLGLTAGGAQAATLAQTLLTDATAASLRATASAVGLVGDEAIAGDKTFSSIATFSDQIIDKNGNEVVAMQVETAILEDVSTGLGQASISDLDVTFSFTPDAVLDAVIKIWDSDVVESTVGAQGGPTGASLWGNYAQAPTSPRVVIMKATPGTNKVTVRVAVNNVTAGNVYYRLTVTASKSS